MMIGIGISIGSSSSAAAPNVGPTVAIASPTAGATVYDGKATTISGTCGDIDGVVMSVEVFAGVTSLGLAVLGAGVWSLAWTPATALVGAQNLTAVATDDDGATTTSAAVAVTVGSKKDRVVASGWGMLFTGADYTEDEGNAEAGVQISQWTDVSGNARHATQTTTADDQPTVITSAGGDPVVSFDKDDGTSGDGMVIPHGWLSSVSAMTIVVVAKANSGNNPAQRFVDFNNATAGLGFTPGAIRMTTSATTRKDASWAANANWHIWLVEYDGSLETANDRVQFELDENLMSSTATGTLPTSLGTWTAAAIGYTTARTVPLDADVSLLGIKAGTWTGAAKAEMYAAIRALLADV